ncbi:Prepilin peptidase [Thermoanaerobacterium xylanolyticum LX-11]|uniref:Prepilin leader peptidase/N-methyltransferase n=1 Tax=Thermoanaerobacterium xylanolyticum (strain ATCC 49914 / DSM 7097 / LX-11) TaxID=858215 RepID=F6BL08_THEXL|nr:A24 family peptidase [Thermoanaerobacterium xylanolyticum]AEF17192.1 Prepilin peptidase [Thermoanaerobacterium xylanolyticum LX-11]
MFILYILVFVFGLIIGSFLNVVIYRLPRNESIVYPPSHCTNCESELKPYDLVPVISYIFLRGRCRYCGNRISIRYPIVELLTGFIYLILFIYFGISIKSLSYAFLASLLIVITFIDMEHKIIPNKVILIGLIAGAAFRVLMFNYGLWDYIVGFLIGGGVLLLISLLSGGGMGGGDIKLMAMIGLFIGWKLTISTLFLAVVLGAIGGIAMILFKIKTRKDYIPFGPYISIACLISILYGYDLLNMYIKLIRG